MSKPVPFSKSRYFPAMLGFGSVAAFILFVELLIYVDFLNRFIVPPPSDVFAALPRVIMDEHVLSRFLLTAGESLAASVLVTIFGVAGGVLLYQFKLLRLATETWVAAIAAAPLVLMYPLYLVIFGRNTTTIVMMGFTAGLAPVILKTLEGLAGTRRVLINVGRSFNLTRSQQFWKILFPAALPTIFVGHAARTDLRDAQHRRRRVPDQFRRPWSAHQRAGGALRPRRLRCCDLFRDPGEHHRLCAHRKA